MTATVSNVTWAVGDALPPLVLDRISRTTLALFAGGSGDHNPIHLDIDVARDAGMEDVFAQGMLSMAYLGRLLTDTFPQSRLLRFTTRFNAITPVNARPTCHGEVTAVEDHQVTLDLRVVLDDGTITLSGQAVIGLTTDLEGNAA